MRTGNRAWRTVAIGGLALAVGCTKPADTPAPQPPAAPLAATTLATPSAEPTPLPGTPKPTPMTPAASGLPSAKDVYAQLPTGPATQPAVPQPTPQPAAAQPTPPQPAPPAVPVVTPTVTPTQPPPTAPPVVTPTPPPVMPTPEPTPEPSKPKYPDEVNGRKLDWYLKQTSYVVQRDPQLRDAAIRTLPVFGPSACGPSINPLVAVIEGDPDPGVRIAAIAMVSSMGFEHRNELKKAVATLKRVIAQTGRGSALRVYCVRSLGSFGPDAAVAVPELRSLATVEAEPSWETRMAVAEALGYVGMPPKAGVSPNSEAVKTLIERMLEDPCLSVRLEAVKSLLSVGPPQTKNPEEYKKEVAPYLTLLQKHLLAESGKDPVRGRYADKGVYVWLLLLQIMYDDRTAPENLKLITKLVKEPEGNKDATGTPASVVRLYAIQAIGAMGPQFAAMRINPALAPTADAAIQSVIDAMNYTELPLQVAAMMCLAKIGNEARKAVPELEKIKARPLPPKPANAPPDWRADDTLQRTAGEAIDYIMGKKKLGEPAKKEEKKDAK